MQSNQHVHSSAAEPSEPSAAPPEPSLSLEERIAELKRQRDEGERMRHAANRALHRLRHVRVDLPPPPSMLKPPRIPSWRARRSAGRKLALLAAAHRKLNQE
jgi:hypothetical protein